MPPVPRRRSTRYRPPSTSPTGFAAETMPMAPPFRRLRPPNPARDPGTPPHLLANYRSEEHTSELQSQSNLVCRLLLEKKKKKCSKHASAVLGLAGSHSADGRRDGVITAAGIDHSDGLADHTAHAASRRCVYHLVRGDV